MLAQGLSRARLRGDAMILSRRQLLHLAAGAAALPFAPHVARAQTYPTRPVRIVVPITAGGANDIIARSIGQHLSKRLGQPFVIENRPGAGGNIGVEFVRKGSARRSHAASCSRQQCYWRGPA